MALSLPVLLADESLEDVLALPGDVGPPGLSKRVWISTLTAGAGLEASKDAFEKACDCLIVTRLICFGDKEVVSYKYIVRRIGSFREALS